jgi:phosphoenolpyruvate phosphomutase
METNAAIRPMTKAAKLRVLLHGKETIIVAGAHSALSAKLVEEAGFHAIWASGFEISTLRGVPDANILTMAELLEVAKEINEPVAIPVIADCDNGFGNAINVIRAVQEYEKGGIAGICIEDSIFPKRCSFYSGVKRELVSIEEHVGKIRAAKKAQKDPDFVVIARTEALIAGWGLEEALRRARAYAEAGADAILIHSKAHDYNEVKTFAGAWKNICPLVSVPTTYYKTTVKELEEVGFKMVIFANHTLRASIKAMRETLHTLRQSETAGAVENSIASLEDVYELIGLSELRSHEKEFLPQEEPKPRAVIVAAGFEQEWMPLIQDRPKGMLDIKGKTILERQIASLRDCGIHDIVIVRGYKAEQINLPNIRYYDHPNYEQGYILSSFFQAEKEMDAPLLFLYSDILFEKGVLEKLLGAEGDICLVIDRSWLEHGQTSQNANRKSELVVTSQVPPKSHRFIPSMELEEKNQILKIGSDLSRSQSHGEFIGMAFFSKKGCRILREIYHQAEDKYRQRPFQDATDFAHASFSGMMQEIIDNGFPITAVEIYKGWIEIDTLEDYHRVRRTLNP